MNSDPGANLLKMLGAPGLPDTLREVAEASLDHLQGEGFVRDLPVIGGLLALAKAGTTVRDHLFFKKVIRFLKPVAEVPDQERQAFLRSLSDEEFNRAKSILLNHLDRIDSEAKAEWLGSAYRAYMQGEITFRELHYFAHYLDKAFVLVLEDYLKVLKAKADKRPSETIALDDALALEVVGFYERKSRAVSQVSRRTLDVSLKEIETTLELSDGGWRFIQCVFRLFRGDDAMRHWLKVGVPTRH